MVAAAHNIKQRKEVGSLSGRGQHRCGAALQLGNFGSHIIAGGVLKPGIEISACLQIKQLAHILRGSIFKRGALNNRNLTRLSIAWSIASLNAFCINILWHASRSFLLRHSVINLPVIQMAEKIPYRK